MSEQLSGVGAGLASLREAILDPSVPLKERLAQLGIESPMAFGALFVVAVKAMVPAQSSPQQVTRIASDISTTARIGTHGPRDFEALIRGTLGEPSISSYLDSSDDASLMMLAIVESSLEPRRQDPESMATLVDDAANMIRSLGPVLPAVGRVAEVSGLEALRHFEPAPSVGDGVVHASFLERQRWPVSTARPKTLVSTWILSVAFRDGPLDAEFKTRKSETGFKWQSGDLEFVKLAFDMAVHAYVEPVGSIDDAMRLARGTCLKFGSRIPKQIDLEAVVRSSVGDSLVSLEGIKASDLLAAHTFTLTYICDMLDASQSALNGLLLTAEQLSIGGGWEPIPA